MCSPGESEEWWGLLLSKLKEVLNLLGFSAVRQEYRISIISLPSGTKARARKTPMHDKTYEKARQKKTCWNNTKDKDNRLH